LLVNTINLGIGNEGFELNCRKSTTEFLNWKKRRRPTAITTPMASPRPAGEEKMCFNNKQKSRLGTELHIFFHWEKTTLEFL
jgi:hypothetical protein